MPAGALEPSPIRDSALSHGQETARKLLIINGKKTVSDIRQPGMTVHLIIAEAVFKLARPNLIGLTGSPNVSHAGNDFPAEVQISTMPFVGFAVAWLAISYSVVFMLDATQLGRLSREDGVVEYIGAALFLFASILYFLLYKNSRAGSKAVWIPIRGNVFYFLLGVAFLFVCMEEISWGQRLIGFETPDSIREMNSQSEFNFHNLDIFHGETESGERKSFLALLLNMDRLFSIFWFSYCFLVPLIYRYSTVGRAFLKQIMMPIVPMALGLVFVGNYAANKALELIVETDMHHSLVEIKESNIAMLFFVLAVWFMRIDAFGKTAPAASN